MTLNILLLPGTASCIPWTHTTLSPLLTHPFSRPMSKARKRMLSVPIMLPMTTQ